MLTVSSLYMRALWPLTISLFTSKAGSKLQLYEIVTNVLHESLF